MMGTYAKRAIPAPILLQAEPEPLEIDLQRTALIVIDMQNAFVSKGGFLDLQDADISPVQKIVNPIKKITSGARAKGIKVIYTVHGYSPDLCDAGGPNSPNWYKEGSLVSIRKHPEWRDKVLISGTWGADIVEELKSQEGDIIIRKQRYSACFGTNLDTILKTYNTKYLVFVGVATNFCVEASIRDAFYLDYFPILISDACAAVGPPFTQDATEFNVKLCYGWVATTENLVKAME